MVARIEHEWVATSLLEQLRVANPEFSIRRWEKEALLKALSWYAAGDGTYAGRRSFVKTSEHDSMEWSLGLKLLLGNLPVMKRQLAWYSGAYPEEEMGRCPLNHRREATEQQRETSEHQTRRRREEAPIETMAHYLECYSYSTDPAPAKAKDDSAEEGWKYEFRTCHNVFVGVSMWDWEDA
ncbi:hypothetical protein GGH91_003244 [Coemansia sp. RSA 2671]|nr:hypothetical protein GGH91_003244 [Coemansia sp. RSA 2671]